MSLLAVDMAMARALPFPCRCARFFSDHPFASPICSTCAHPWHPSVKPSSAPVASPRPSLVRRLLFYSYAIVNLPRSSGRYDHHSGNAIFLPARGYAKIPAWSDDEESEIESVYSQGEESEAESVYSSEDDENVAKKSSKAEETELESEDDETDGINQHSKAEETEFETDYSEAEDAESEGEDAGREDMENQTTYSSDSAESDSEMDLEAESMRQMEPERKVTRPSVTWGVLLTQENRRIAQETVLEYLKGEGINTSELAEIELPTAVEVMKQRLGFLRKLGLNNDDINYYPLMLGCSVQKNMVPVLKYLNKIGLARQYVPMLLRKYPNILHASVVIDILPVIYFLQGLDIDPAHIPNVLLRYPDLFAFKQEGTMSTSVAYLVSIGVKMRAIGGMLTEYPELMGMRVASVIKPRVEYLISLGIPQSIVARILERRPHLLGYDLVHRMQDNVGHLLTIGVKEAALPAVIAQYPEVLGRVFDKSLQVRIEWLKEQLQVDSDGIARMTEKMPQLLFLKNNVVLERIGFLKSMKFSSKEVAAMVISCPQILVLSIDDSLKPNMNFLVRHMKRSLKEVAEFPAYLTYSLETRIRPRYKVMQEKGIKCSLSWFLNCSDGKFEKRMEADSEDSGDAGPTFVMGGLLPGKQEKEEGEWQPRMQTRVASAGM